MPKKENPKDTIRDAAYELWMKVSNPMVTFFKTFDVTNLIKVSRKRKLKFNMLLDIVLAEQLLVLLPVGDKLIQYDTIAAFSIKR